MSDITTFEEIISHLSPEQQARAHRALNDQGARILMGSPGKSAGLEGIYLDKDQHILNELAKLDEVTFNAVIQTLNRIKNYPEISNIVNEESFYSMEYIAKRLISLNLNEADKILNSYLVKELKLPTDFYSLVKLTQISLVKLEYIVSYPKIRDLVDLQGSYEKCKSLEIIANFSHHEFENAITIMDNPNFFKFLIKVNGGIRDEYLPKLVKQDKQEFALTKQLFESSLNPLDDTNYYTVCAQFIFIIDLSLAEKYRFKFFLETQSGQKLFSNFNYEHKVTFKSILNLSAQCFKKFIAFLSNEGCNNFFNQDLKNLKFISDLSEEHFIQTLKILQIPEFNKFIAQDYNKLIYISKLSKNLSDEFFQIKTLNNISQFYEYEVATLNRTVNFK
jgi:hypothetical protein